MSPRPLPLTLLALTLSAGCGEEAPSDSGHVGVELLMSRAVADQIASFQLVVLPNSKQRDCTDLQKTCLRQQVKQNEALVLKSNDTEGRALRFPMNLSSSSTQDVSIAVPVGRDYVLIIEAISGDTPPRFLGSSCTYLPEVNASGNAPVLANTLTLNSVDCDPTFD